MPWALRTDRLTGRVALYDLNGTSGDPADANSTMNLPLNNPASFLDLLKFHSDLDHFEVAFAGSGVITHAAIAAISVPSGQSAAFQWNAGSDDQLLMTHSLGYEPFALVVVGSNILWPGMPVQNVVGGARYAAAYVDTTTLRIATTAAIGANAMGAQATTYQYLVFKNPPAASGHTLIGFTHATGITEFGLGKVSADRPYLQVKPGGSPYGFPMGRTIDLNNGAPRAWKPGGTHVDAVPSGIATYLTRLDYDGNDFGGEIAGSDMAYAGSGSAPASIQVQAP